MKTKKFSKGLIIALVLVVSLAFISFTLISTIQQEPWEVPDKYKNMKNPVEVNDESIMVGKGLYNKNCASCHGKKGLGDGVKARGLETFPGDMSSDAYKNQTDGEQYYKSMIGRGEMPNYEGKITEEDMWNIVIYMDTF